MRIPTYGMLPSGPYIRTQLPSGLLAAVNRWSLRSLNLNGCRVRPADLTAIIQAISVHASVPSALSP